MPGIWFFLTICSLIEACHGHPVEKKEGFLDNILKAAGFNETTMTTQSSIITSGDGELHSGAIVASSKHPSNHTHDIITNATLLQVDSSTRTNSNKTDLFTLSSKLPMAENQGTDIGNSSSTSPIKSTSEILPELTTQSPETLSTSSKSSTETIDGTQQNITEMIPEDPLLSNSTVSSIPKQSSPSKEMALLSKFLEGISSLIPSESKMSSLTQKSELLMRFGFDWLSKKLTISWQN